MKSDSYGVHFALDKESYPVYSNVLWSAFITDRARIRLHEYLLKTENPIYCDTDSIFYNGERHFEYRSGLGDFESTGRFDKGEFWLPKLYLLEKTEAQDTETNSKGKKTKVKGVPFDFQDEFLDYFYVEFFSPVKYREALRRGLKPNEWIIKRKAIKAQYDKRHVNLLSPGNLGSSCSLVVAPQEEGGIRGTVPYSQQCHWLRHRCRDWSGSFVGGGVWFDGRCVLAGDVHFRFNQNGFGPRVSERRFL